MVVETLKGKSDVVLRDMKTTIRPYQEEIEVDTYTTQESGVILCCFY